MSRVRWEALFADMEMQLDAAMAAERDQEVAELTRAERATVLLADRVRAATGATLRVSIRSGAPVDGVVADAGSSWVLLTDGPREHVVPLGAVVTVQGLPDGAASRGMEVSRRLGLAHVLRAVSRDRSLVRVRTVAGELLGRLDAVASDHVEVAGVHPDTGRPSGARQVVTFAGLDLVSRL